MSELLDRAYHNLRHCAAHPGDVPHPDAITRVLDEYDRRGRIAAKAVELAKTYRPGAGDPSFGQTWTGYEPFLVGRVEMEALAAEINGGNQ